MSDKLRMVLALDDDDLRILQAVVKRLGCTRSDVLRWALRHYAMAGPWRGPDEELLPPLRGKARTFQLGPLERQVS